MKFLSLSLALSPLFVIPLSYASSTDMTLMPWEAIGHSGYVRNKITGEVKVSSPELARLNDALKKSWERLGYKCKIDCAGHQAGWDWAEDNGINNRSECDGSSRSFIEGCHAYVRYLGNSR